MHILRKSFYILAAIKEWAGPHMFDENYEVPTKPPLYLFEGNQRFWEVNQIYCDILHYNLSYI